jgi:hypothetical protein
VLELEKVPPPAIAEPRDLTWYGKKLIVGHIRVSAISASISGSNPPAVDRASPELRLALIGCFRAYYDVMLKAHLSHIDYLDTQVAGLDAEVDRVIVPFADQLPRLTTVPGVGQRGPTQTRGHTESDSAAFGTPLSSGSP